MSIKGGGGLLPKPSLHGLTLATHNTHTRALLSTILALASIIFSSSRDLGASLPLSPRLYPLLQAPPVQDSTVLSHAPLLDVRPHARNQDKPVHYCVASCINIWDEEHAASSLVGSGPPGQDTDNYALRAMKIYKNAKKKYSIAKERGLTW